MSALAIAEISELDAMRKRRDAIMQGVRLHADRCRLSNAQKSSCVDVALSVWRSGRSAAHAVRKGRETADAIARHMQPMGAA